MLLEAPKANESEVGSGDAARGLAEQPPCQAMARRYSPAESTRKAAPNVIGRNLGTMALLGVPKGTRATLCSYIELLHTMSVVKETRIVSPSRVCDG